MKVLLSVYYKKAEFATNTIMGTNINEGAITPPHPEGVAKTTATTTAKAPKLWHTSR